MPSLPCGSTPAVTAGSSTRTPLVRTRPRCASGSPGRTTGAASTSSTTTCSITRPSTWSSTGNHRRLLDGGAHLVRRPAHPDHGHPGRPRGRREATGRLDFGERQRYEWTVAEHGQALGGHGGGDFGLVRDWVQALSRHDESLLTSTLAASMESHLIGFTAEESRHEGGTLKVIRRGSFRRRCRESFRGRLRGASPEESAVTDVALPLSAAVRRPELAVQHPKPAAHEEIRQLSSSSSPGASSAHSVQTVFPRVARSDSRRIIQKCPEPTWYVPSSNWGAQS